MTKLKATVSFDLDFGKLLTQEQIDHATKRMLADTQGTPMWEGCKRAAGGDAAKFLELVNRAWVRKSIRDGFNVPAKVTFHKEQPKPVRPTLPKEWWVPVNSRAEAVEVLKLLQGKYRWRSGGEALEWEPSPACTAIGCRRGKLLWQRVGIYAAYSFHANGCTEVTVQQLRTALGKVAPRIPETSAEEPERPVLPKDWWVQVGTPVEVLEVLTLLHGKVRWASGREALGSVPTECIALGVYQGDLMYQYEDMYGTHSFHDDGCTEVTLDQLRTALGKVAPSMPETTGKGPLQALPSAWYIEGITAEQLQELQSFKLLQELGTWISGEPFNERGLLHNGERLQFKDGEFAHFSAFKYGTELSFEGLLDYCKHNEVRAITLPEKWHVHLTSQGQLESLQCSEHLRKLGNWIDGEPFEYAQEYFGTRPVLAFDGTEYHRERNAGMVRSFNGESHEFTFEELRGLLGDE